MIIRILHTLISLAISASFIYVNHLEVAGEEILLGFVIAMDVFFLAMGPLVWAGCYWVIRNWWKWLKDGKVS